MTINNSTNKDYGSIEMDAVYDLIETYGTQNPYILCKKLNISVRFADLGNNHGLITDENTIIINEKYSLKKKHMICAILLGIVYLHNEITKDKPYTIKNIFNQFDPYSLSGKRFAICITLADKKQESVQMLIKNYLRIYYGLHISMYNGQAF